MAKDEIFNQHVIPNGNRLAGSSTRSGIAAAAVTNLSVLDDDGCQLEPLDINSEEDMSDVEDFRMNKDNEIDKRCNKKPTMLIA